jgi:hypothetical protein
VFRAPILTVIASRLWIATSELPTAARNALGMLWFITGGLIVLSLILLGYFLAFVFRLVRPMRRF